MAGMFRMILITTVILAHFIFVHSVNMSIA
jgi:hypothetical protein